MKNINAEIEYIENLPSFSWPADYFENVISYVKNEGLWLEFGVCSGNTINIISSKTKNTVYGFDSFLGLPEDWGDHQPKGAYSRNGNLPSINNNVELVVGLFQDTLDDFLKEHKEPVAYLHLDADLYSSTKFVLDKLKKRIVSGTVISFDEIRNYPEYRDHEIKAWLEFSSKTKISYEWISRTDYEQATCIVK
jgi:hypothetical protein